MQGEQVPTWQVAAPPPRTDPQEVLTDPVPGGQLMAAKPIQPCHITAPPPPSGALLFLIEVLYAAKAQLLRCTAPPPIPHAVFPSRLQPTSESDEDPLADIAPPVSCTVLSFITQPTSDRDEELLADIAPPASCAVLRFITQPASHRAE
jgi:hypothetical protein